MKSKRKLPTRARRSEEMSRLKDEAEAASRAKSAFLANMSHEIRTPLNAILGMAEMLSLSDLDANQSRQVRVLRNAGQSLIALVGDILDLAKVEAGKLELAVAPFELRELFESVAEIVAIGAHRKRLHLTLDLDPGLPTRVRADEHRLRQVLLNLLGNAVKFTDRGGISLQVVREAVVDGRARLRIAIRDTGIGIPEEKCAALFRPFSQVDATTSRTHGGTGLGLSLCERLVNAMDGRIWFESIPGVGSTFSVRVELPIEAPAPGSAIVEGAGADLGRGRRALLADDLAAERASLRTRLERLGFAVSEAEGGGAAIAALAEAQRSGRPFDVVLLDAGMPSVGGLEVVEAARDLPGVASRSVLLLTADQGEEAMRRARALELAGCVVKPAREAALVAALRCALHPGAATDRGHETKVMPVAPVPRFSGSILVADDSEDNRLVIQEYLAATGVRIECAENGEQAVAKAAVGKFDLILMDLHMPVIDGFAAIRAIRSFEGVTRRPRVPIVTLTADALTEGIAAEIGADCDGHLCKPVARDRLLGEIGRHLTGPNSADAGRDPVSDSASLRKGYLRRREEDVVTLQAALQSGDLPTIYRLGHNMKGSGRSYGFPEISRIGSVLERAGKAADREQSSHAIDDLVRCIQGIRILDDACGAAGCDATDGLPHSKQPSETPR